MKLLLVLSFALGVMARGRSYNGYQVFTVTPRSQVQYHELTTLNDKFNQELDFWRLSPVLGDTSDVLVAPQHLDGFKAALDERRIEYTLKFSNVQDLVDQEAREILKQPRATGIDNFDYNAYHSYQEISNWISDFRQAYGGLMGLDIEETQFVSYEGRAIKALKLSTGSGHLGAYTQGGIHAREWVSPATVINLLKKFVDAYHAGDSVVTEFFGKFDWYVVPVLNVDGYHYTRPESTYSDRYWRKNMQDTGSSWCWGIDMNRNYGYKWGGSGSSSNKCHETYSGAYAYDAYELGQVTSWLMSLKNAGQTFKIHVDIHSYSQYWVYPLSYTYSADKVVPDRDELQRVALAATDELTKVHGTKYTETTSGDWYPAAGASEDFGYMVLGATYSYTLEMRDTGRYGFELPANQIQPTGEETYAGMHELFRQVLTKV